MKSFTKLIALFIISSFTEHTNLMSSPGLPVFTSIPTNLLATIASQLELNETALNLKKKNVNLKFISQSISFLLSTIINAV